MFDNKTNQNTMSLSVDKLRDSKDHLTSKTAEILHMESQLNKLKKLVHMEIDLRKNKDEFNKLCQEISEAEQRLKSKKRERINEKLMQIQKKQEQRNIKNKQSNQILAKIKEDHRQRRKRMESLVNQYKKQYDYVYHKKLMQRRQNTRFNLEDITEHQRQYLKSIRKFSNRVKTESLQKSREKLSRQQELLETSLRQQRQQSFLKRQKIMQLVNRRIQYGNKAEKEALKVKIPKSLFQKLKEDKQPPGFDKNIDAYNQEKQRYKKPKLDTNFNGDIQQNRYRQIKKIATQQSPTAEKLNRLRHIVDGLNQQYGNGQVEVLDMMCSASLTRANLLLKQS